jgi:hypothetical protein
VNHIFDSFYNKISEIIDKHVPMKKLSKKQKCSLVKPWITKGLKVSIAKNNKLHKSYLRNRNEYFHLKYKLHRNKLKHLLNISKKSYSNYFHINKWKYEKYLEGYKRINYF